MDISIPDKALEAAEEAISLIPYDVDGDSMREAEAALNAAAALIVAAVYEQIARDFRAEYDELTEDVDVVRDPAALELYDKAKGFRARAKELRGGA